MTRIQNEYRLALCSQYSRNRTYAMLRSRVGWKIRYIPKKGFRVSVYHQPKGGGDTVPLGEPEYYHPKDPDGIPIHRIKAHLELAYNLTQLL